MEVNSIPRRTPGTIDPKTWENILEIHRSTDKNIVMKKLVAHVLVFIQSPSRLR